jgi:hypothetical protein
MQIYSCGLCLPLHLVSKYVLRNSEKSDKSGVADQMMVSEDDAEYSEEEVEDSEEEEEYSDEDEKEESDFDAEEGSEDENIVLAEIGGDASSECIMRS